MPIFLSDTLLNLLVQQGEMICLGNLNVGAETIGVGKAGRSRPLLLFVQIVIIRPTLLNTDVKVLTHITV